MKQALAITLAVVLLLSVAPQPAQSNIGLFASWWDASDMNTGVGGGLKYQFKLIPLIDLDARISYISFSDVDLHTVPLEVTGLLDFGIVYGGLALGYYMWGGDNADLSDEVGGTILVGASLGLGGIGVFGELRYTVVQTTIEGAVDAKADGFGINLGVHF
jgi:hypothetical protein